MKYLPILDELFSSNSYIILLLGIVMVIAIGLYSKKTWKKWTCAVLSLGIYGICEIVCGMNMSFFLDIIVLFLGTAALGCAIGFLVLMMIKK